MDSVRLADLWRARLESLGWSSAAREQLPLCLAASTQVNYDRYIGLFRDFCAERNSDFPPSDSALVADFLVEQCSSSERPHSMLRCISAALAALYEVSNSSNRAVDPVDALRVYLDRTESIRCPVSKPVFLSLVRPFTAVSAGSVAAILQEAIYFAEKHGLSKGHTPKDFRPTGATRAVQLGFDTDDVQRLGRWKTRSVFLDHYVHNRVDPSYTQKMFE